MKFPMFEGSWMMDEKGKCRAAFLDRDGTINEDTGYLSTPDELIIYPWSAEAIKKINQSGMMAIVLSNQSGIARGYFSESDLALIHKKMIDELEQSDAKIDAVYYCPHLPVDGTGDYLRDCDCRKPRTGLIERAVAEYNIDITESYVIGDKMSDIELAENANARGVLVLTGEGKATFDKLRAEGRKPFAVAENLLEAVRLIL